MGKKVKDLISRLDKERGESSSESSKDDEELRCTTCNKVFTEMSRFRRHVRDVHKQKTVKEKTTYSCEQCHEIYTVRS